MMQEVGKFIAHHFRLFYYTCTIYCCIGVNECTLIYGDMSDIHLRAESALQFQIHEGWAEEMEVVCCCFVLWAGFGMAGCSHDLQRAYAA